MRSFAYGWILTAVLAALAAAPTTALAQGQAPKVITAVAVQVEGADQDAFLERVTKAQAIWKKLDLPAFRVWQSTLAGTDTGTIIVVTEYDGSGEWAKQAAKLQDSAEWQEWIDELQSWGKTTLTSNSMLVEITP